jgi:RNA polymerase sigma factor (sigma-70 family)
MSPACPEPISDRRADAAAAARAERERDRREDRLLAARCATAPPARAAWEELYATYSGPLRAWIRRGWRLGNEEGVEDLVQQVFVLCSRGALARYRGEVSLRSYLCLIADRARITENRRLARKRRDVRAETSLDVPIGDEGGVSRGDMISAGDSLPRVLGLWRSGYGARPDEASETGNERAHLRLLVTKLEDSRDREILIAYYWGEDPDRVIGERLGLATDTVTWRRHRALAQLRRTLRRSSLRSGDRP